MKLIPFLLKTDWYDPTVAANDEFFGKRDHSESAEHKRPKEQRKNVTISRKIL